MSSHAYDSKRAAYDDFRRALSEEKKRQADAARRPQRDDSRLPLAAYCHRLLDGPYRKRVKDRKMSPNTWALYEIIVGTHLVGSDLGLTPLGDVTREDVEDWLDSLTIPARVDADGNEVSPARPHGNATKLRYAGFLSGVFEYARRQERLVDHNPVRDADKPRVDPDDVDFRILSLEEADRLLAVLRKWEEEQDTTARPNAGPREPHVRNRTIMAAQLGLHGFGPGELLGMKREDLAAGGLTPKRQGHGHALVPWLKNRKRRKWVPVDDELLSLIEGAPPGLLVRADAEGTKPVSANNLRRTFRGALKGTEFEGLTPYDLRHTFAMRLLEEGTDVQTAAELMRHSTETFLRRYVRSREALKREAVKRARRGKPTHEDNPRDEDAA